MAGISHHSNNSHRPTRPRDGKLAVLFRGQVGQGPARGCWRRGDLALGTLCLLLLTLLGPLSSLPRKREEREDARTPPSPSPPPSPPPASGSGSLDFAAPPPSATQPAGRALGTALSLEALQERLEALKALQGQYLRGQLRIRRTCRDFPRALRALSLQICRSRRRLIRAEVRLQRRETEGAFPNRPSPPPSELLALASSRQGFSAAAASLSGCSLLLLPAPPPPPAPPPLPPHLPDLHEALETFLERQERHLHDRQRDYRSCQECLRSIKTLRGQLRRVRSRLWRVEAELGLQVPPRELSVEDQDEEDEDEEDGPPWLPPALPAARRVEARGPSAQNVPPVGEPPISGRLLKAEVTACP
ncbi:uncharacterized protein LOC131186788 [Ahaetulla prasina]|uniref:uncharacterized protein LOC131186788 n=1 Tax=Ahaetulla prasina TaxID=499056 RepID=UPI002649B5F1|nr:uncharacterized protein LOC131186788 [Ahaetulla prasina]